MTKIDSNKGKSSGLIIMKAPQGSLLRIAVWPLYGDSLGVGIKKPGLSQVLCWIFMDFIYLHAANQQSAGSIGPSWDPSWE